MDFNKTKRAGTGSYAGTGGNAGTGGHASRIACAAVTVALAGCLSAALAGCSGGTQGGSSSSSTDATDGTTTSSSVAFNAAANDSPVALSVNGTIVFEDDLTAYIQSQRANAGLADDAAWGSYLAEAGMSALDVRADALDKYLSTILMNQSIANEGITVTDDEVDQVLQQMEDYYNSMGDNGWEQVRQMMGYDDDATYKIYLKNQMLSERLYETVIADVQVSDEDVQAYLDNYCEAYAGKRASFIIMPDEESAAAVKSLIDSGALTFQEANLTYSLSSNNAYTQAYATATSGTAADSDASVEMPQVPTDTSEAQAARDAVKATYLGDDAWQSALETAGDTGWHSDAEIAAGVGGSDTGTGSAMSSGGVAVGVLADLAVGQVSDPISTIMGVQIIMCTGSYDPDSNGTSLDDLPQDLQDEVRADALAAAQDLAWAEYVSSVNQSAQVDEADMPSGLPYDVEIPQLIPTEDGEVRVPSITGADESAAGEAGEEADVASSADAAGGLAGSAADAAGAADSAGAAEKAAVSMDVDISSAVGDNK